jgi:hypothetical protein
MARKINNSPGTIKVLARDHGADLDLGMWSG